MERTFAFQEAWREPRAARRAGYAVLLLGSVALIAGHAIGHRLVSREQESVALISAGMKFLRPRASAAPASKASTTKVEEKVAEVVKPVRRRQPKVAEAPVVAAAGTSAVAPQIESSEAHQAEGDTSTSVASEGSAGPASGSAGGDSRAAFTGEEVLPFGEGMTPPRLVSGDSIRYTREALEAHLRAMFIARCTITATGEVRDCRVIKSVPLMEEALMSALLTRRYEPVRFQGQPVSVKYVFNIKLEMP